jgi:hypothetical protein
LQIILAISPVAVQPATTAIALSIRIVSDMVQLW